MRLENSTLSSDFVPEVSSEENFASNTTNGSYAINFKAGPSKSFALEITEQIEMYFFYSVAPVGIILNTISFITFLIIKSYRISTGLHLVCISLADVLVFFSMFLRRKRTWNRFAIIFVEYQGKTIDHGHFSLNKNVSAQFKQKMFLPNL